MKIIIVGILFLTYNISYADECTGALNAYLESLNHIIKLSKNEKDRQHAMDKVEGISFQRLTQEDCAIRSDILGLNDEKLPLSDSLSIPNDNK